MTIAAEPVLDQRIPALCPADAALERALRRTIHAAGLLAAFCEHVEHNESSSIADAKQAGRELRSLALDLSAEVGQDLLHLYEARIRQVETASLLCRDDPAGAELLSRAHTWADVQSAQLVHDRQFHPDVFGLSKLDQIRHYTFHVTKLVALLADAIDTGRWADFEQGRLADLAVFGVKIATVCNERLPEASVDRG